MFWPAVDDTPELMLACWASMMARSSGPPGTTRVMANSRIVIPKSVGGINRSRRMK
jgi:hypothetical protein